LDRYTLPKNHLLRTTGEFQRVYRSGLRLYGKGFALIFLANALEYNRLGISVHRKAGNAVRRNRIKRLVREVFRLYRDLFPAATDIVLTVRPGFAINSLFDMQTSVARVIGA
jgi:ribonuclease P protein component